MAARAVRPLKAAGCHNRADVGIGIGAPTRPEAIGHFPEDHRLERGRARRRCWLLERRVVANTEQFLPAVRDRPFELEARLASRRQSQQQRIEPVVEVAPVGLKRCVGQPVAAPADGAQARCFSRPLSPGAKTVSPPSMAY